MEYLCYSNVRSEAEQGKPEEFKKGSLGQLGSKEKSFKGVNAFISLQGFGEEEYTYLGKKTDSLPKQVVNLVTILNKLDSLGHFNFERSIYAQESRSTIEIFDGRDMTFESAVCGMVGKGYEEYSDTPVDDYVIVSIGTASMFFYKKSTNSIDKKLSEVNGVIQKNDEVALCKAIYELLKWCGSAPVPVGHICISEKSVASNFGSLGKISDNALKGGAVIGYSIYEGSSAGWRLDNPRPDEFSICYLCLAE